MKLYSRKKRNPLKVILLIIFLVGASFALSKIFTNSKVDDIVVAQVGTENIYKSEVEKKLADVFANNPSAKISFEKLPNQVLEILAREVFLDKKILAEAKRLGLDNSKEVKNQIESFKTTVIRQAYENNQLKSAIDDQKIVEKFNEINSDLESKNEFKYSQIVVRDESLAKNIIKEFKSGKRPLKFFDGARKYSIDNHSSSSGGEIDFKPESAIKEPILNTLKTLKKDEISAPFLVEDLWYIVKLVEVKKPKSLDFETSKEYVKHLLKMEEIQKINGKFIKDNQIKLLIKRTPQLDSKPADNPTDKPVENSSDKSLENNSQPQPTNNNEIGNQPTEMPAQTNEQEALKNEVKKEKL